MVGFPAEDARFEMVLERSISGILRLTNTYLGGAAWETSRESAPVCAVRISTGSPDESYIDDSIIVCDLLH